MPNSNDDVNKSIEVKIMKKAVLCSFWLNAFEYVRIRLQSASEITLFFLNGLQFDRKYLEYVYDLVEFI